MVSMPVVAHGRIEQMGDSSKPDLRRRLGRDLAELIVGRSKWLMPADRSLIEAVYAQGLTALAVSQMLGERPPAVRRRIRKLVERVLSVRFEFVMRRRDDWPPTRRRVATVCVLQGRSMRSTANHLRLSLHVVRRQMGAIGALLEASR